MGRTDMFGSSGPMSPGMGGADYNHDSRGEKRTFKDKLHIMIQEAEQAEIQAMRENQLQDKKSISIQMLVDGRPQAVSDFFSLTHGRLEKIMGPNPVQEAQGTHPEASNQDVPQEALSVLKNYLIIADDAKLQGDTRALYNAYKTLAQHFIKAGKLQLAQYFLHLCVRAGQDNNWPAAQKEALLAMGAVRQQAGDVSGAIACYERRMDLLVTDLMAAAAEEAEEEAAHRASEQEERNFEERDEEAEGEEGEREAEAEADAGERRQASVAAALRADPGVRNLMAVLMKQAVQKEAAQDVTSAAASYSRCLLVAERCGDDDAAARVHFQVGRMLHLQERYAEAISALRSFLDLCDVLTQKEALADESGDSPISAQDAAGAYPRLSSIDDGLTTSASGGDVDDWAGLLSELSSGHGGGFTSREERADAMGVAFTSFADCLLHTGDKDGALACLEEHLQEGDGGSLGGGKLNLQGAVIASCSLGMIHYSDGRFEDAVRYFERFFEAARVLGDNRLLDSARVNLGAARGAMRLPAFLRALRGDEHLGRLLHWKNARVPFFEA